MSHPEEQAILDVVRRSFAIRYDDETEDVFTGPLLDHARLMRGLPGFLMPVLRNAEIRGLAVRAVQGGSAWCDCDIVVVDDYATPRSGGRAVGHVTGPLVLQHTDGGWRVADFVVDNRHVLETLRFYALDVQAPGGAIRIGPRAVQLARGGTALVFEVENCSDGHAFVEQATLLGRPRLGAFFREKDFADLAGTRHVEPGRVERVAALWWLHKLLQTPRLDVDVRIAVAGLDQPARVELALPFAGTPEPRVPAYDELRVRD